MLKMGVYSDADWRVTRTTDVDIGRDGDDYQLSSHFQVEVTTQCISKHCGSRIYGIFVVHSGSVVVKEYIAVNEGQY